MTVPTTRELREARWTQAGQDVLFLITGLPLWLGSMLMLTVWGKPLRAAPVRDRQRQRRPLQLLRGAGRRGDADAGAGPDGLAAPPLPRRGRQSRSTRWTHRACTRSSCAKPCARRPSDARWSTTSSPARWSAWAWRSWASRSASAIFLVFQLPAAHPRHRPLPAGLTAARSSGSRASRCWCRWGPPTTPRACCASWPAPTRRPPGACSARTRPWCWNAACRPCPRAAPPRSRRPTPSAAASSAICTTARSSA